MNINHLAKLKTLAERVKTLRLLRDFTQAELAAAVGIKQQSIQAIESGKTTMPTADILHGIAKKLEVSPAWLLFGTEEIDNLSAKAIRIAQAYDALTDDEKRQIIDLILRVDTDKTVNNP